jgi:hypothetical protein
MIELTKPFKEWTIENILDHQKKSSKLSLALSQNLDKEEKEPLAFPLLCFIAFLGAIVMACAVVKQHRWLDNEKFTVTFLMEQIDSKDFQRAFINARNTIEKLPQTTHVSSNQKEASIDIAHLMKGDCDLVGDLIYQTNFGNAKVDMTVDGVHLNDMSEMNTNLCKTKKQNEIILHKTFND